jgi:hypothetical protein
MHAVVGEAALDRVTEICDQLYVRKVGPDALGNDSLGTLALLRLSGGPTVGTGQLIM